MTTDNLQRYRDDGIVNYLSEQGGKPSPSLYICSIVSAYAQAAIGEHLCPHGEWPETIPAKRRALASGIDAAIKELQEIKTAFNLDGRK